jgi:hypothetical protein
VGELMAKKGVEKKELLWRILILIVSGIILSVWRYLIVVLAVLHFIMVLFSGKRDKSLADFCEYWNSEIYRFIRYLTFGTNERPFPFNPLNKLGKFEK